jgi:hypothetical protein
MSGLMGWHPDTEHLARGMKPGQHLSGRQVFIAAGPPLLQMVKGTFADVSNAGSAEDFNPAGDIVYPIGLLQTWALQQNRAVTQLFEIGSRRSYFMTGHTVGQISLSSVLYHGPNLLRILMAWLKSGDGSVSPFNSMLKMIDYSPMYPWTEGDGDEESGTPAMSDDLPVIEIAPGYANHFFNLASDAFDLPHGLFFLLRDTRGRNLSCFFLEQCYIPGFQIGTDSSGLALQESCSVRYERMIPIPLNSVALINGISAQVAF